MDLIKIGRFIAELRQAQHMTQEQLGEKLGVTNKTVSRWERGNYLPSIEMFQLLSQTFNVSINELLAGEYLSDADFRKQADQNIVTVLRESTFSYSEQRTFWLHKWRRDHLSLLILLITIPSLLSIFILLSQQTQYLSLVALLVLIEYTWQNHKMLTYVENKIDLKDKNERSSN